ncbi:MAG: hypothetical protein FWD53_06070 [Phycisphaerales bacterium]|nr:hypothetical protein [Phycisphaerales bacterium]
MSLTKRTILLSTIIAIATPLWAAGEPIKVPLTTTVLPENTIYAPAAVFLGGEEFDQWRIELNAEKPTKKITLGGIECTLQAEKPDKTPENNFGPCKLILKTPTQTLTIDAVPFEEQAVRPFPKPVEITLDNGRKYFLTAQAFSYYRDKDNVQTNGITIPSGIQTGKIKQTPIALFDSNFDGFYTIGQDGIVVGSPTGIKPDSSPIKINIAQPLSKYISTPTAGIFEIQSIAKNGSEITLLPYTGPTATIEVTVPPTYAGQIVLTSDTGLNVTLSDKAALVIPGSYTLLGAALAGPAERSPLSISGDGMPSVKVEAGKKQVLTLSGPKVLEFQAAIVDGKVNIKTDTLLVKGLVGETYKSVPYDHKNPPEVHLNVDGKSVLLGKMSFG